MEVLDLPVAFGGVSIGQQTAKLSIKVDREHLNIAAADEALCGRRITGKVAVGRAGDTPGQMLLIEEMDDVIEATFDIHRFGVTPDAYTSGLTFQLKEIDVGQLARFSKGSWRLIMNDMTPIPRDTVEEVGDDEEDGQQTINGTFATDMPWRKSLARYAVLGFGAQVAKGRRIGDRGRHARLPTAYQIGVHQSAIGHQRPRPSEGADGRGSDVGVLEGQSSGVVCISLGYCLKGLEVNVAST